MRFTPDFPLVAKIGSAEAGYGKMRFMTSDDFGDFRGYAHPLHSYSYMLRHAPSCLALHKDYVTLERLIEDREYDIRVQKIGTHLRAYKRMNSNWKGNVGTCVLEEIEVTPTFREWAEECGKLFGGMDILTVVCAAPRDLVFPPPPILLTHLAARRMLSTPKMGRTSFWRSTIRPAASLRPTSKKICDMFGISCWSACMKPILMIELLGAAEKDEPLGIKGRTGLI